MICLSTVLIPARQMRLSRRQIHIMYSIKFSTFDWFVQRFLHACDNRVKLIKWQKCMVVKHKRP